MTTLKARRRRLEGTAALLSIALIRDAPEPLNRQLYLRIGELIRTGRLAAGTRLTSTRRLSLELGVSRTVTIAAYDQLAAEGYIEPRRGSGQYVRWLAREEDFVRPNSGRTLRDKRAARISLIGRPFDPTSWVEGVFPRETWTRLLGRSWRKEGKEAEAQGNWAGLRSLREAIARHIYALRGIECTYEDVLVTHGNTDALQLIVDALAPTTKDRKAGVWVEDPGHISARTVLFQKGMRLLPVPVDEFGIDVEVGHHLAGKARLALVTPSRQFPLGMPLTLERRLALVAWARECGAILIEDDYDTEIRFSGRPIASLLTLDPQLEALSLGSFSKLTFPGLRLGYIVGARRLIKRLAEVREHSGTPVGTTAQPALAGFLADGGFAKHLRFLRHEVTARRVCLIAALARRLPDEIAVLPQEVGMHLTVLLKRNGPRDTLLAAPAAKAGLNLHPLSAHYIRSTKRNGFLLGYAGWNEDRLISAVDAFATLVSG